MAVNQKPAQAAAVTAEAPQPEKREFKLELAKIQRYIYGGNLYLASEQYVFDEDGARHMLSLRDPQQLPVFRIAKPRKKVVLVDDDAPVKAVRPPRVDRMVVGLDEIHKLNAPPAPLGKIELGEDDPETAERLAAISAQGAEEAGLIDSAQGQTL